MFLRNSDKNKLQQFLISIFTTLIVSYICFLISDFVGYRAIALILLFSVSILAILLSVYPVLVSALLSALIWDYFFIPPYYTFHIENTEDALMLCMYFIIALLNGILTAKIRQFEKQERLREERLNALKLYNTLFNSISHELRTPITAIMGATENMISDSEKISQKEHKIFLNEIMIATKRLNKLIDNLLNMSRLESGQLKPKKDWCDVNELIYSAVNRLKDEIAKFSVEINIPENMPLVKIDFGLIEQAVYNILNNAIIHTPENTKIFIQTNYTDNVFIITISDNGQGFPEESFDKIFQKVYYSENKKTGGLGLGLSIVKGFVNAHNGTIEVSNILPHGAKIVLNIPAESTQIESFNE